MFTISAGERHKNLDTAAKLYIECAKARLDREACIVALGGGVVQDIVNFVAATFKRGVPFIQIPTSLLSQVDIGIGGCAVDHPLGKSLIGTFYQCTCISPRSHSSSVCCCTSCMSHATAEAAPSSSGLGHRIFDPATGVRLPLGSPFCLLGGTRLLLAGTAIACG